MRKPKRTWTDEQFIEAVKNNTSIADTIRTLGLVVGGANYKQVHLNVERLSLDISHWLGRGHGKGNHLLSPNKPTPLSSLLINNSTYSNINRLKKRLLSEGLLENKCYLCGQSAEWKGKELILVLDHKNGDNRDHRIENLHILCPNCDSQQPTFKGRNVKDRRLSRTCPDCGGRVSSQSKSGYCKDCVRHHQVNHNQYSK